MCRRSHQFQPLRGFAAPTRGSEALHQFAKPSYAGGPSRAVRRVAGLNLKIGELYLRQGSTEQARHYLQKVLDTAPPESSEALRAQAFLEDLAAG